MSDIDVSGRFDPATALNSFLASDSTHDHWSRASRLSSESGYYWMLTFEGSEQLSELAATCGKKLTGLPYDLVPEDGLHLTIGRIAMESEIGIGEIHRIAGRLESSISVEVFDVLVGWLTGTAGALGFLVNPYERILQVSKAIREVMPAGHPEPLMHEKMTPPHITIGYANACADATSIKKVVQNLHTISPVQVQVQSVALVRLSRRRGKYSWTTIRRVGLGNR
jgi:2'-5' RNA ligase